ncbi:MAG: outer membrane beta-barrel protein [Granulosicoccus sp.]
MKNITRTCVVLASVFSASAHADLYFGIKAGSMLIGFDDVEVAEDPASVAGTLGYQFESFPSLSVEAEVSRTVSTGLVVGNELEVESQGVYFSYTSPGRIYYKGRIGYMDAALVAGDLSEDEGGETYGVAVGIRLQGVSVELDYTAVDDDVNFVSIGLRF